MEIVNVVVSGNLNQKLDLNLLYNSGLIDYDPDSYHGGYVRLSKYSVTIYHTGKYIVPGIKKLEDIPIVFNELKDKLSSILDTNIFQYPEIRNIVALIMYDCPIDLAKLSIHFLNKSSDFSYEPEVFPGLIWKTGLFTANMFSSGKIVVLGTKNETDLKKSEKIVLDELISVGI